MRLLGVCCLVGTTGRCRDRLGGINAAFGRGDTPCRGQHIDPSTNGIEAMHHEWARFAEIEYLSCAAGWWIPQLAQRDVTLRVAGVDVRAVRREAVDGAFDDRPDGVIDDEAQVHELVVDRLVAARRPSTAGPRTLDVRLFSRCRGLGGLGRRGSRGGWGLLGRLPLCGGPLCGLLGRGPLLRGFLCRRHGYHPFDDG